MKKLLNGISDFRKRILPHSREKFAELAKGQNPDVLFFACSDSRVAPNWFASTDPGDLFVIRNVGNLIPPASQKTENSALAAAEFSILQLGVTDIVVCGHSDCGAMNALLSETSDSKKPNLNSWLSYGKDSLQKFKSGAVLDAKLSPVNQLSQVNVLQQIEHLKTHALIRERLEKNQIQIHGWWFDIAKADVFSFNESRRQFQLIE